MLEGLGKQQTRLLGASSSLTKAQGSLRSRRPQRLFGVHQVGGSTTEQSFPTLTAPLGPRHTPASDDTQMGMCNSLIYLGLTGNQNTLLKAGLRIWSQLADSTCLGCAMKAEQFGGSEKWFRDAKTGSNPSTVDPNRWCIFKLCELAWDPSPSLGCYWLNRSYRPQACGEAKLLCWGPGPGKQITSTAGFAWSLWLCTADGARPGSRSGRRQGAIGARRCNRCPTTRIQSNQS